MIHIRMNFIKNKKLMVMGLGTLSSTAIGYHILNNRKVNDESHEEKPKKRCEYYSYDEIKNHNKENDIWVTYKDNIYDITYFIDRHPGGKDKIMLAGGGAVEPYWNIYKQHYNCNVVQEILQPYHIGKIKNYSPKKFLHLENVYINDPKRYSDLRFHSVTPCNAEPIRYELIEQWITPNYLWYIRNHTPVPDIDIKDYSLTITDLNNHSKSVSLDYIKSLPSKEIIATLQCGGNRREEMENTSGTKWRGCAISNAEWKGVLLRDLLKLQNIDTKEENIKHVHFIGIDGVKASIPIQKAFNEYGDVLIAYEMNEDELPKDHGYPLRVIVPGYVGIRNIKWLKEIKLSDKEVEGSWQKGNSYKPIANYKNKDKDNIDLEKIAPILEMPIQSEVLDYYFYENKIKAVGFAWSGGGRNIVRVDVSMDNGKTWNEAKLLEGKDQEYNCAWAWTFWEYEEEYLRNDHEIMCRAVDSSYNIQPKDTSYIWNSRGLINNSWHKFIH